MLLAAGITKKLVDENNEARRKSRDSLERTHRTRNTNKKRKHTSSGFPGATCLSPPWVAAQCSLLSHPKTTVAVAARRRLAICSPPPRGVHQHAMPVPLVSAAWAALYTRWCAPLILSVARASSLGRGHRGVCASSLTSCCYTRGRD